MREFGKLKIQNVKDLEKWKFEDLRVQNVKLKLFLCEDEKKKRKKVQALQKSVRNLFDVEHVC